MRIIKNGVLLVQAWNPSSAIASDNCSDPGPQTIRYIAQGWRMVNGVEMYDGETPAVFTLVDVSPPVITAITTDIGTVIRPRQVFRPRAFATAASSLSSIHIYFGPPPDDYYSFVNAQAFLAASGTSYMIDGNPITAGPPGTTYTFYARCETSSPQAFSAPYGPITFTVVNNAPDTIFDGASYSNGVITGSGWAGDFENGAPVTRVEIFLDGVYKGNSPLGEERGDVAGDFGASYRYSGYRFSFPTGAIAMGNHVLTARAVDEWDAYTDRTFTVTVPNRPPENPTISSGGVTDLALDSNVILTGSLSDPDGNLVYHALWYLPPGGSWTLIPGAPTTPSGVAQSTVTASFKPTSPGVWQFRTNGHDAGPLWNEAILSVTVIDRTEPDKPAGLNATENTTGTSFKLSWSRPNDNVGVTSYMVLRDGSPLGPTPDTWMLIIGLAQITDYSMQVQARDAAGNPSGISAPLLVRTPDKNAPSIPGGLSVTANTTGSSFTLNWNASSDNAGVTAYEVMQDETSLGLIAAISKSVTGVSSGATYNMKVRAGDATGNWSTWSAVLPVSVADLAAPSVPTGLAASNNTTGTSLTLSWTASTDNVGVTAYEVKRGSTVVGSVAPSVAITGLSSGTSYTFTVQARDAAGNWSDWSAPYTVSAIDVVAPSPPSGLSPSAVTSTSFTLSWAASTDNVGVTGYEVSRNNVPQPVTTALSSSQTGLTPGTEYTMTVKARDAAGRWSAASAPLLVPTSGSSAPTIPGGLAASARTATGFTLSWNPSTDDVAVTKYQVRRDSTILTPDSTVSPRVITGLSPGVEYLFRVKAGDAAGNFSDWSIPLTFTLADTTLPTAPTGLAPSLITPVSFTLNWTAATDNGVVVAYEIRHGSTTVTQSATGTSHIVTGLWPGTPYSITMRAKDAAGNWSLPSIPLSVSTTSDSDPTNQTLLNIHRPN